MGSSLRDFILCVHNKMMKREFGILVFISLTTSKFKLESFQNIIFTTSVVKLGTDTSLKSPLPLIWLRIEVFSLTRNLIIVCSNLQHNGSKVITLNCYTHFHLLVIRLCTLRFHEYNSISCHTEAIFKLNTSVCP